MHHSLPLHGTIAAPTFRPRFAVAAKGFRPFFLLAAAFACLIVPIWILIVSGVVAPKLYLDAASWHAHEMVFGFTVAVIAGFLLTAVGNWTQRETITGTPLLLLAGLWVLGRVAMAFAAVLPGGVVAAVDLAFLPALIVVLARPLFAAKSRRNFVMLVLLAALFAANVVVHLHALGLGALGSAKHACLVAVDLIVLLIVIIAGRVLPMFTRNATGETTIGSTAALEIAVAAAMAGLAVLDLVRPDTAATQACAGVAGLLAIARAKRWVTPKVFRHPLLWVLHVSYAWIPLGLLLRAAPLVGLAVWSSLATHALTVGAIGSMTLGMMARVALGHSGRPLVAPRAMAWGFGAMTVAAVARVLVPLVALRWHFIALIVAATFWSLAFGIYLAAYSPILLQPRADGKAG
jgi:uncharacterized protein involved in response to NO